MTSKHGSFLKCKIWFKTLFFFSCLFHYPEMANAERLGIFLLLLFSSSVNLINLELSLRFLLLPHVFR